MKTTSILALLVLLTACGGSDPSTDLPAYCAPGFVGPISTTEQAECDK